jgi:hypothetical protein
MGSQLPLPEIAWFKSAAVQFAPAVSRKILGKLTREVPTIFHSFV